MKRPVLLLLALLVQAMAWADDNNPGVPTPEQAAQQEQQVQSEENQARRNSPLVVYDKRGKPAAKDKPTADNNAAASRDTGSKGFSMNVPTGGGLGSGSGGAAAGGYKGRSGASTPAPQFALAPSSSSLQAQALGKTDRVHRGACEAGGYRQNAEQHGIEYARLECQRTQLKGNKALLYPLAPLVPAPALKSAMDKLN